MTRSRTSPPARRHRLLVVDDEAYNVDLIRRTFHRTSLVFPAANRGEAEAVLAAEPIDLALVDYRLAGAPGGLAGSGLDLAQIVRARRPAAAIVMVTGFADEPSLIEALERGVIDELVAKPWQPAELRRRVEALLARRAAT
ncbi:MAG TPA: response regulator [Kofleriaceae bacterium]|nr:response regulator [Kofleriaceae bacterium]